MLKSWKGLTFSLVRHLCLPEEFLNSGFSSARKKEFLSCLISLFSTPVFWAGSVGSPSLPLREWLCPLEQGLPLMSFCFLLLLCYPVMWTPQMNTSDATATVLLTYIVLLKFCRVKNIDCHFPHRLPVLLVPSTVILTESCKRSCKLLVIVQLKLLLPLITTATNWTSFY